MLVLVRFLLGQVGSLRCWGGQPCKQGSGSEGCWMTFPFLPVAALAGEEGPGLQEEAAPRDWHWQSEEGCTALPQTFCPYRGLEDGVGQLQGFWQWPGTDVFSGMSLRLCKGMSPGHFFSHKISPTLPICPTMGHRESCLATLQLQLT